jgi:Tfp pilus assembly protein PilN
MNNQDVIERLDILISLMIPPFQATKYSIKGLGLEVLKLSDSGHTLEDMEKKLKKSKQLISNALGILKAQNLVKSITKDNKTFYIRLQ